MVDIFSIERLYIRFELFKQWREVSWAAQADLWKSRSVSLQHSCNSVAIRILRVTVDCKAVSDSIDSHVSRNASESEDWETLVTVIWLKDATNISYCLFVLIIRAEVMK